ncbi:TVP38/TMEM64 family protein [Clostridium rectalis]|uniref:TVP38/TMEM64 family protein n=1 Tax=Clostridium rectalis TaxID=2040295 RepID=UPI000F63CDBB|nr:TVP38/TMEM64 family protein [Clostridium rectalis]
MKKSYKKLKSFFYTIYCYMKKYKGYIIMSILLAVFIYSGYEYYYKYSRVLQDPKEIKRVITSYGSYSVLAFIVLQIIQVVVFFIPGEIIQIAGGYIFGTFYGSIISLLGITMGSIIIFLVTHRYGKPFVEKVISGKKLKHFRKILKLGSINYIVFLLYLIPGIPKDALAYICGVSNISFRNFVIYSTVGRLPGIFISAYFGAKIDSKNIPLLITIAVCMSIIFIIGVFKGEKIIKNLTKNQE